MADEETRKRAKDFSEDSADEGEDEEEDVIGPMPAPPPKAKKRRGTCNVWSDGIFALF